MLFLVSAIRVRILSHSGLKSWPSSISTALYCSGWMIPSSKAIERAFSISSTKFLLLAVAVHKTVIVDDTINENV